MTQEFDSNAKLHITRDANGVVRDMLHAEEPFESTGGTALLATREYLEKFGGLLGIAPAELASFSAGAEKTPLNIGVEYRFSQEKPQFDMTTVVLDQTYFGLPVWQAAVAVHMRQQPFVILSAQSSRHATVDAEMPSERALGQEGPQTDHRQSQRGAEKHRRRTAHPVAWRRGRGALRG